MRYFLNKKEAQDGVVTTITICEREQDHLLEIEKPSEEVIQNLKTQKNSYNYSGGKFSIQKMTKQSINTPKPHMLAVIDFLEKQGMTLNDELAKIKKDLEVSL